MLYQKDLQKITAYYEKLKNTDLIKTMIMQQSEKNDFLLKENFLIENNPPQEISIENTFSKNACNFFLFFKKIIISKKKLKEGQKAKKGEKNRKSSNQSWNRK